MVHQEKNYELDNADNMKQVTNVSQSDLRPQDI